METVFCRRKSCTFIISLIWGRHIAALCHTSHVVLKRNRTSTIKLLCHTNYKLTVTNRKSPVSCCKSLLFVWPICRSTFLRSTAVFILYWPEKVNIIWQPAAMHADDEHCFVRPYKTRGEWESAAVWWSGTDVIDRRRISFTKKNILYSRVGSNGI